MGHRMKYSLRTLGALLLSCVGCGGKVDQKLTPENQQASDKLKQRIVMIEGEITDDTATLVVAKLLYLNNQSKFEPITIEINSPGGMVTAGLAIVDTMRYVKAPVHTRCTGRADSMAAILLACGSKGNRSSVENAGISLGPPRDLSWTESVPALEMERYTGMMKKIVAETTKMSSQQIEQVFQEEALFSPEMSVQIGIIDQIDTP